MPTGRLSIKHVTIDCAEPQQLARWWAGLLDWHVSHDGGDYVVISSDANDGGALGFIRVDEPKTTKNRLHLDLAAEGPWPDAISRARELGAVELAHHREHDQERVVFAAPDATHDL
ncbi:VOC family protein [Saccharopolyspora pogona]|uniref:VOC family protein n=1 Tax=Saccharopolyspora pogona TaxID=333966 RepID=UPI00168291FE|nr:VOC family protein [Saccharopolyspora pogona]